MPRRLGRRPADHRPARARWSIDADARLRAQGPGRAPATSVVAARGGKGGKGNIHFKSATNRAPRQSTPGDRARSAPIRLELKLIADVGLVGKPNAGKSTLFSRLSRARPEIAPYPFTTKYPNLGRVQIDFDRSFILADIPGLIEGAHAGAGLGHEFLRHIQRAGILVHLVEPEPADGSEPLANYRAIREELELYDAELGRRRRSWPSPRPTCPAPKGPRRVGRSAGPRGAADLGRHRPGA